MAAAALAVAAVGLILIALVFRVPAQDPGTTPAPAPETSADPNLASGAMGVSVPGPSLAFAPPEDMALDLDRIAALGARWVRFDIPWDHVQHADGAWHWDPYDRAVAAAQDRGLRVLGILGTVASPSRPPGTDWTQGVTSPEQRRAFADYAAQAARRYAGRVTAWEVWNEPNLDQVWAPKPSVNDYAALLREASAAIRPACSGCLIIAGGTGGAIPDTPDIDTKTWYDGLAATGALDGVDAVGIHPYSDRHNGDKGEMSLSPAVRAALDAHGYQWMPLWGTELGAPQAGDNALSEHDAARIVREAYTYWTGNARRLKSGPLFWYTIRNGQDPHHNTQYGLIRDDGTPTLAYRNLQQIGQTRSAG